VNSSNKRNMKDAHSQPACGKNPAPSTVLYPSKITINVYFITFG
jgi:hypothetical protein